MVRSGSQFQVLTAASREHPLIAVSESTRPRQGADFESVALAWPWPVKVSYQRSQGIHAAGPKQTYSQDCNAAARLFPDVVKALYRSRGCEGSFPCAAIRCSHRQTVEWRSSVSKRSGSGRIRWSPSRVTGEYRVCDIAGCLA